MLLLKTSRLRNASALAKRSVEELDPGCPQTAIARSFQAGSRPVDDLAFDTRNAIQELVR